MITPISISNILSMVPMSSFLSVYLSIHPLFSLTKDVWQLTEIDGQIKFKSGRKRKMKNRCGCARQTIMICNHVNNWATSVVS